jgi:hypothetical protein
MSTTAVICENKGIPSQKMERTPTQRSSHLVWVIRRTLLMQGAKSLEEGGGGQRRGKSDRETGQRGICLDRIGTHRVRNMRRVTIAANTASGTNITGSHI